MSRQPCLSCGTPVDPRWHDCPTCGALTPRSHAQRGAGARARRRRNNKRTGRRRPGVQKAMREARTRDGRCLCADPTHGHGIPCGVTHDLTAHLPGGGLHPPDPDAYVTLCRRCHGKIDG